MHTERMRKGLEVLNKIDGKMYKVMAAENGIGRAVEMVMDEDGNWTGELNSENDVIITEKNALAFRIMNNPEPYPIPEGYSVQDGKLLKDGIPACEAGGLVIKNILATQKDFLILAVADKETKKNEVKLMAYQVSRDRFTSLYSCSFVSENFRLLGYAGKDHKRAILGCSNVVEKEVSGNDGNPKKVRFFDGTWLITVEDGKEMYINAAFGPTVMEDAMICDIPDSSGDFEAFLPSDEQKDENGYLVPREKRLWIRTDGFSETGRFEADGSIRADWSYIYREFVIRTDDMLMVPGKKLTINSPKVAELAGYNTLIDITKKDYEYRLTFSDSEYNFKTLSSKSTRDRGYIVTVE